MDWFTYMFGEIDVRFAAAVIVAYLLGSISPSILLAKASGKDIKKEGSGNAGTTNTLRVLGAKAALITLIVDVGKGVLAVTIAFLISTEQAAMLAALFAFIGHVWPVFFGFKGGKGVAVAFGVILRLDWKLALVMLAIIAVTVLLTRYVSLGSIVTAASFPFVCHFMYREFVPVGIVMALILIFKHSGNIKRLIAGEEDKLSLSRKKKPEPEEGPGE